MKKLKLMALEISASGVLTREQLRNIVGGSEGGHCQTVADCGLGNYACINSVCFVTGFGNGCVPACTGWGQYCDGNVCRTH
jgi:hypothetical protein